MDNMLKCWGSGSQYANGHGTTSNSLVPVSPSNLGPIKQVQVGYDWTCALTLADDKFYCWGYGET